MPDVWEWGGDNCAHIWHYCFTQWAWEYVQKLLTDMVQELVVVKNPRIFQKFENIWFLLRDIILWSLQIKWNNFIFNNEKWCEKKLQTIIWNL
jgi:hypothetical protein